MATGNMQRKIEEVRTYGSRDIHAERQTGRETDSLITILHFPTGDFLLVFHSDLKFRWSIYTHDV